MLYIGDKIFYPNYGCGEIISVEEKEIYGEIKKYYIIKYTNDLVTMVPINSIESKRIRKCVEKSECISLLKKFNDLSVELPKKWLYKTKLYNRIMREGNMLEMLSLLNTFIEFKKEKRMSNTEEKLFDNILEMVSQEISIVLNIDIERVKNAIESKTDIFM